MACSLAMKAKGLVLVSLVAMTSILGAGASAGTVQPSRIVRQVPAMYVFGDSGVDVGNNNFLPGQNVRRANTLWYGVDFPGRATGRYSNGYNVADFVAMTLGLKESPPAYLSLAPHPISLVLSAASTGVNYASGGSGILDWTGAGPGTNIPLSQQLRYFQSTKALMVAKVGSRAVSDLLARSFFLIDVGSNDLYSGVFLNSDVAALYTILISNYAVAITGLYEMGARKFGIINVGPIGCLPFARMSIARRACNDTLNLVAAGFDDALRSLLAGLASSLPGVTYSLADNFRLQNDTFANPQASGFVNIDRACCECCQLTGAGCPHNSTPCPNRDHFFWWDLFHTTQRFGKLSAAAYYDGPAQFTFPINFKQLAIQE